MPDSTEPLGVVGGTEPRSPRRPVRDRKGLLVTGGVVVAVPVILAGVLAANRGGAASYRTAAVERGDVEANLDAPGTVHSVDTADLSFPVAGTVSSVMAVVGQQVTVGQPLAQLDTTALDAQVASARSAVASAQAKVDSDAQSQTSGVAPAAFVEALPPSDPLSAARDLVTEQQTRLVTGQHRVDQELAQQQHDLATETSLCKPFLAADGGGSSTPSATTSAAPPTASSGQPSSPGQEPDARACQTALTKVLADQQATGQDQQALAADLPALDDAVDKLVAAAHTDSQPPPPQNGGGAPGVSRSGPPPAPNPAAGRAKAAPSAPAGGARGGSAAGRPATAASAGRAKSNPAPATAEQLAADQAALDADQAQLGVAQQTHDQATLVSPINGTVGSVTLTPGQSVQGGQGTPQIVVLGPGSEEVNTTVTDTNVGGVRVGDLATVTPSGSTAPLHGRVVSIGLLAASDSSTPAGSVSYPVTLGLTDTGQQHLFEGQSATITITLAHVSDALTVPSSAVRTIGANHVVTVLRAGTPTPVRVTIGTAGPTRTQVLSGLNPGDQVVLADLSQPLPTTNVTNIRRTVGGGGGRPGG